MFYNFNKLITRRPLASRDWLGEGAGAGVGGGVGRQVCGSAPGCPPVCDVLWESHLRPLGVPAGFVPPTRAASSSVGAKGLEQEPRRALPLQRSLSSQATQRFPNLGK